MAQELTPPEPHYAMGSEQPVRTGIIARFESGTASCVLDIPLAAGEDYADGLARVAPIIRDAMGIEPAKPMPAEAWQRLKARVTQGAA